MNVEYEEREDEFDIVRGYFIGSMNLSEFYQEDIKETARRKMLQEEDDVDVYGMDPDPRHDSYAGANAGGDEDFAWADDEPDDDVGGWKMKLVVEDESELG